MNLLLTIFQGLLDDCYMHLDFAVRLVANVLSLFVLIRLIYYPNNGQTKFILTFFLMGMMVFLLASVLDQVSLDMGFALGLFAIFGIIRYRTPSVELKEMAYLFVVIGMSVINALIVLGSAHWFGLIFPNLILLISAYSMEQYKPRVVVKKETLVFTPSSFQVLGNNELLVKEIETITSLKVFKVEVLKTNVFKSEVTAWIYYKMIKG
ncbi:MAG: DUF4956 domain-containing protein [Prolixibacteraceae bacterium]|jgi:hypothetical protein|nr:DUF4956 domain-containing protein [Prolixibacteraceae bacterium]MBT7000067.1 DUF4956 domain-containing protein [Prolixibacteraceae bacterium]MBT7396331.1 DUF4956 domain-containing protein [Prolixibacteraceae bacterium]